MSKASVYGYARAFTPLLDEPLQGPVFLRASDNPLPDLVVALDGQVQIELVGRIDSKNRGIRTTFDVVPDAPVDRFRLEMQGGKKGLIVNSRDLCKSVNKATVRMNGHNGRQYNTRVAVKPQCPKTKKKSSGKRKSRKH